jgi:hypothetical protein
VSNDELKCRNCDDPIDPRRVKLGYDYCLKQECQEKCLKPVTLAAIGINKAADYYTRADEVLPPRLPAPAPAGPDEPPTLAEAGKASRAAAGETVRTPSTIERLRRLEAQLDRNLEQAYQRFERGEITAREMEKVRDGLVASFNEQVTRENIRYRSMLRPRRNPARRAG